MCWALLAFMISFNLFIPELNDIITSLDGENLKGFNFILFSTSALLSRPFSGKLSDTIGRKKVMYIGITLGIIVIISYPFVGFIFSFLSLRFFNGFSAGFTPTGATALVTDLIPPASRGVAMGIWGTFISVGFGIGNFFSGAIRSAIGLDGLFYLAAGFAVLSGILVFQLKETLPNPVKFSPKLLKIKWNDVFEPTVLPAAFIMFCSATSSGVVFVTTPDISTYLGIENKGWFFLFYMLSTVIIRLFASNLSDKIGRRKTLILGLGFMMMATVIVAISTDWIMYTVGAIIFGVATGISSPTVMAWTADLSPESRRGVGAGTVFMALEAAIIFGAVITLFLYDSTINTVPYIFLAGASMSLVGIIYLVWHLSKRESIT